MLTISVLTSLRLYFIGSTDLANAWKEEPAALPLRWLKSGFKNRCQN